MTVDPGVHANQQANFRVGMGPRPAGWYSAPTRSRAIRSSIAVTGGPSGDVGLWMRVARSLDRVGQVSDPGDRDCAGVTGLDRREGAGAAGEDNVAGTQCQIAGEVDESLGDVAGELAGVGGGDQFPVDMDGHRDAGEVEVGFDPWSDGRESVAVLGLGHHLVEWDLVDGGDVVADGVAEDRRGDVGGGQVAAGAPDDDGEFGLDMYLTEMVVQDDGGVGVGDGPRRLQERLRRS